MKDFKDKIAVVTGGGSGMGRELVRQLVEAGCHVATCDLNVEQMTETRSLALADASSDTRVTTHVCDVGDEAALLVFRDEVAAQHQTEHVNLLFNNAGISGGGSLFENTREDWDRTFNICWGGVYWGTRAFLPLIEKSTEGHIINTSSVNGFWASLGPDRPHTAYSAAKFAVKGFTEALMTDLAVHAPHIKASVVMPGHIGTSIVSNSSKHRGTTLAADEQALVNEVDKLFHEGAPMTAPQAATVILDGVRDDRWRILVGNDAHALDEAIRANPEGAYVGDDMVQVMMQASQGASGLFETETPEQ